MKFVGGRSVKGAQRSSKPRGPAMGIYSTGPPNIKTSSFITFCVTNGT